MDGATNRSSFEPFVGVRIAASSSRRRRSRSCLVDIIRRPASGVLSPPPGTDLPPAALAAFSRSSSASLSSAALRSLGDSLLFVADLAPPRSPRIQSRSSVNSPLNVIVLNSTRDLRSSARIPSATRRSCTGSFPLASARVHPTNLRTRASDRPLSIALASSSPDLSTGRKSTPITRSCASTPPTPEYVQRQCAASALTSSESCLYTPSMTAAGMILNLFCFRSFIMVLGLPSKPRRTLKAA